MSPAASYNFFMPYSAEVYKVMIASPGDVATERQVIRDVVHEWNAVHSEDRAAVLMPVGWESHASPQMGLRPQEVINRQVLKNCDLLIAAFWTRIGSPTGEFSSGTVEEIEEHLSVGKPAMIYFSNQPVKPDSVDAEQYQALRDFKDSCRDRGLIESYDSISEFREKISRHLAQTVIRNFVPDAIQRNNSEARHPAVPELSQNAKALLTAVSQDREGTLFKSLLMDGLNIQTNGKRYTFQSSRDRASMESAISQLESNGLVQDRGYKGEVFVITEAGYQVADWLKTQQ